MRVGVVFPQLESGTDPGAIREYAQGVEQLGYAHLVAYDHVLGADRSARPDYRGAYDSTSLFHEVFVLLSFIAAWTTRLELAPSVVILPQRQTALVAKQAASLDVLAGGRTRLGVGLGWNEVEFVGLNERFDTRAKRYSEQIKVLRMLFANEVVDFTGTYHRIDRAGIRPLPVRRAIPIWMGGNAEDAVKRIARIGDGWFTFAQPDGDGPERIARFREYVRAAGRDPETFPIEGRVVFAKRTPDEWASRARGFADLRTTHLEVNTMGAGYMSLADHLEALARFRRDATELFTAS
ncbi:MAG TPA: LLM class F420-dependent oxidoreductase [Candidatus Limnocylindria bacterium]|nr:LLM class F420-dependent oxidoreductase [Candidatus Limnocylindria bacterium]